MAKKKIPTVAELREYLQKEDAYLKDCIENNKTFVITGPKFPGGKHLALQEHFAIVGGCRMCRNFERRNMGTV